MIKPVLQDDALLADIQQAADDTASVHLWWLGQSGFLIQWQRRHLLIDPYLSDSLTKKYADTDKPHVRMTELAIDPSRLDFIDVVTSSHNHTDHLDGETLTTLLRSNPELTTVVPTANLDFAAQRLQVDSSRLTPVDDGESIQIGDFRISALPAAHESLEHDEQGRCKFLGYVVQFGPWTIYHSGDTVLYEGMVDRLREWSIDVAILPINGRLPERRVAGNLWGKEAVELAMNIGASLVIPCHFDMFEFNTVSPDQFVNEADRVRQPYRLLQCGERLNLKAL